MKKLRTRILDLLKAHQPRNFLDICTALGAKKYDSEMEVYRTLNAMKEEKSIVDTTPYGTKEIGWTLPGWKPNGE